MRLVSLPYALGAIGLGVVGLLFGDFALQWQPVPAGFPARSTLALLSNSILLLAGAGAILPRAQRWGALGLGAIYGFWVVALHLPRVAAAPASLVVWLGAAEILTLSWAGFMLFLDSGHAPHARAETALRVAFGISALVFGISHFVYAQFTAAMVPAWIPWHLFWALATGAGHCLAGAALVCGIRSRLAATVEALMCGCFVLLLHLPDAVRDPASHAKWTILFIALSIAGAAWTMRLAPPSASRS